jgi:hypothetical protein
MLVDLKYIRDFVEDNLGIVLTKNTREREYVEARSLYFKLCRDFTSKSCSEIGRSLKKHHATVIHSVKNVYDIAEYHNKRLKHLYEVFERSCKNFSALEEAKDNPYEENERLRSEIIRLNIEIKNLNDSMQKEYHLIDGLDKDERESVIEKALVFKKVIQSQRHMKV